MKVGDKKLQEEMIENADKMSDALMNMSKREIASDVYALLDLSVLRLGDIVPSKYQQQLVNVLADLQAVKGFVNAHKLHDDPTPLQLAGTITSSIEDFTIKVVMLSEIAEKMEREKKEQENKE